MGASGSTIARNHESKSKNKISFRCTYQIENDYETQIINDRGETDINEAIKSKIKILNGEKEEELFSKKNLIKLV